MLLTNETCCRLSPNYEEPTELSVPTALDTDNDRQVAHVRQSVRKSWNDDDVVVNEPHSAATGATKFQLDPHLREKTRRRLEERGIVIVDTNPGLRPSIYVPPNKKTAEAQGQTKEASSKSQSVSEEKDPSAEFGVYESSRRKKKKKKRSRQKSTRESSQWA